MTDVLFGSVEAGAASGAGYTDAMGAVMDFDTVGDYAQLTAKASGGGSAGWKLRAIIAGVLTTLLSFAPGSTTAAFAGGISVAGASSLQAVTATVVNGISTSITTLPANTVALDYSGAGRIIAIGPNGATRGTFRLTITDTAANTLDAISVANTGSVTISSGLTVSAGGIISSAVGDLHHPTAASVRATSGGGFAYFAIGNGDVANNHFAIGGASSLLTFGSLSDANAFSEVGRMQGGVLAWGTTSLGTGTVASAGDTVLKNGGHYGSLTTGGAFQSLIALDGNNSVVFGNTTQPTLLMRLANASLPAAGAAYDGTVGVDTTNSRLVFYVAGARYYVAGTSF